MLSYIERKLIFKPTREDHGGLRGVPHERQRFGAKYGMDLDGVFVNNGSDSVVLFTHGNRHNITMFRDHYRVFTEIGQSFFTFDYPGYGSSAGVPSEEGFYTSVRAAYEHVTTNLGYSPTSVVAYGCSLGGAVAVDLASSREIACLITENAFTNSWDMARHLYPYLPIWPFLPKRFANDAKLSLVKSPILIIHAEDDAVVPVRMSEILASATSQKAEVVRVAHAGHVNTLATGGGALHDAIKGFIARHAQS